MGNVHMEASQVNYRGGETKMSVEEAIKAGSSYELPIAGAETLGGVKIGSGLTINAETGVASADSQLPADPVSDGTKVLVATTSEGTTTKSWGSQLPEDPATDGVKVLTATTTSGETVKSWEAPESGSENVMDMSGTVTEIGTVKVSGTEYTRKRKVFSFDPTTDSYIETGLTNEHIVSMYGFGTSSEGVTVPIPYLGGSSTIYFYYNNTNHRLMLMINGNFSAYATMTAVIEYYEIPVSEE